VGHQMNVKNNVNLEDEIYMEQPNDFLIHGQDSKVYKLDKSLTLNKLLGKDRKSSTKL
jgi:hypothetical protein